MPQMGLAVHVIDFCFATKCPRPWEPQNFNARQIDRFSGSLINARLPFIYKNTAHPQSSMPNGGRHSVVCRML